MMAGRILGRRALREQSDQVEQIEAPVSDEALVAAPPKEQRKVKTPAAPKVKTPRAKKTPPRMRARWGIFDGAMKQVSIFDYNQRASADDKLAELLAKKKGSHFLQIVKEPMAEPPPVEAPSLK
jgi:hypothetical protein